MIFSELKAIKMINEVRLIKVIKAKLWEELDKLSKRAINNPFKFNFRELFGESLGKIAVIIELPETYYARQIKLEIRVLDAKRGTVETTYKIFTKAGHIIEGNENGLYMSLESSMGYGGIKGETDIEAIDQNVTCTIADLRGILFAINILERWIAIESGNIIELETRENRTDLLFNIHKVILSTGLSVSKIPSSLPEKARMNIISLTDSTGGISFALGIPFHQRSPESPGDYNREFITLQYLKLITQKEDMIGIMFGIERGESSKKERMVGGNPNTFWDINEDIAKKVLDTVKDGLCKYFI